MPDVCAISVVTISDSLNQGYVRKSSGDEDGYGRLVKGIVNVKQQVRRREIYKTLAVKGGE